MIGLGTMINVGAIVLGGLIGLFHGRGIQQRFQDIMMSAVGMCVLFIGIAGALEKC